MAEEELSLNLLIKRHKSMIFNIFFVLAATYFASKIYAVQTKKYLKLSKERDSAVQKNDVLSEIAKLENRLNLYRSYMSKDVSLVINTLADMAKEMSIHIAAVNPEKEQHFPNYIRYPFSLTLEADNYNTLGIFMGKLESHHDIFVVDSIDIKPEIAEAGSKKTKLAAVLKISTVLFK